MTVGSCAPEKAMPHDRPVKQAGLSASEYRQMYFAEGTYFWFVAKHRLLNDLLRRRLRGERPKVLDAGCGTGGLLSILTNWSEPVGIDLDAGAVEFCRRRGLSRVARGDTGRIPFASGSFDGVVSSDVIEHLEDDRAAIDELYRVMVTGGFLIVTVPGMPRLWSSHDVTLGHKRRYGRGQLEKLLLDAGFDRVKVFSYTSFVAPLVIPLRLIGKIFKKGEGGSSVDYGINPAANKLLLKLLDIERFFVLGGADFRIGTTLVGVARKG